MSKNNVAKLVVCEKNGSWATALRWAAADPSFAIVETRSLIDCRDELIGAPRSFVGLEAKRSNLEGVVRLLWEAQTSFPESAAVVFSSEALLRWEDTLREAGAIHIAYSTRRLDLVARLADAHLRRQAAPRVGIHDTIWARLPWGESE